MRLRISASARRELKAAKDFYERQRHGLGDAFLLEAQRAAALLIENPLIGTRVRDNRRVLVLKRFPYRLVYSLDDLGVIIIAAAHQKRRPDYWRGRVEELTPRYAVPPQVAVELR